MSLAFLFKKTWHPSTLQNSERVWVAEQKDAAEKRRIEELTKQVREEQQVRELEEMQAAGGHGPDRKQRVDWMYEGPMQSAQDQQAEANEFLMGKEFKMEDKGTNELKKLEDSKAPGTLFTAAPATSANEAFRRVQEDPLLRMRKARMEAEESVVNNPVKMSKIRHQLEAELAAKDERKRAKREAKKAKKEAKKEQKREKREKGSSRQEKRNREDSDSSDAQHGRNGRDSKRGWGGGNGWENGGSGRADFDRGRLTTDVRREQSNNINRGSERGDGGRVHGTGRDDRWGNATTGGGVGGRDDWRRRDQNGDSRGDTTERRSGVSGRSGDWKDARGQSDRYGRGGGHQRGRDGERSPRRGERHGEPPADRREDRREDRRDHRRENRRDDRRDDRREARREERREDRRGSGGGGGNRRQSKSASCSRSPERDNTRERQHRQGGRKRSRSSSDSPPPPAKPAATAGSEGKRYGLVVAGGGGNTGARGGGGLLGPAAALLEAKERERSERERSRAEARRRRNMTPEEKMRRLKEMEDDGTRNQELKKQRVEEGKKADARERGTGEGAGADRDDGKAKQSSSSFIDKMRGEQVDGMGLQERMQRNRHYQQRGADVHNFMARG